MIYTIKKKITPTYLAVKIENTEKCRQELMEAFGLDLDNYLEDIFTGKWFVASTENIGSVRVLDHDSLGDEFILVDPKSVMKNHDDWIKWISPKQLRTFVATIMKRYPIATFTAPDEVVAFYQQFEAIKPCKSSDGQFTGGFYQEEYEQDENKTYVFSFDKGVVYQLDIYQKDTK